MAIGANGREQDITFYADGTLKTTTSQYWCVGMAATNTLNDRYVTVCGDTGTAGSGGTPTLASNYAIGINQTYMSSGSDQCTVRLMGVSKAIAAASIAAGQFVRAYQGISTTSMIGRIVAVANAVTVSAATQSIASHTVILGRALEDASTNTVISVFLNPQLYDNNLVASTT
jgi:hypothetical protein